MINSEKLIGTTKYLTQYTTCCINRCRYNLVRHYLFKVQYERTEMRLCSAVRIYISLNSLRF
jgi:hypothetical protein